MKRSIVLALSVAFAAITLAGCGEKPQTVSYKNGKYRGKPDERPWDNAPPAHGSPAWKKGDEQSWDNGLRQRATTQNEYSRTGQ